MIKGVPTRPALATMPWPQDLRIWPHKDKGAPALALHAIPGIKQFIVLPGIGEEEVRGATDFGHEGGIMAQG